MRVDVVRLFDAIKRVTWRYGVIKPERVRHEIGADGSHTITVKLFAEDVEYAPPRAPGRDPSLGRGFGLSTAMHGDMRAPGDREPTT
jgi:hypothetical protein